MIQELNQIKDFLFMCFDQVITIYFAGGVLSFSFAIYIIRKVSTLIDKLR